MQSTYAPPPKKAKSLIEMLHQVDALMDSPDFRNWMLSSHQRIQMTPPAKNTLERPLINLEDQFDEC